MVRKSDLIRSSKRFKDLINKIRAKYIIAGKKPPSTSKITDVIAEKLKKKGEREFLNEFIPL